MNLNRQHATAWVVALTLFGTVFALKARGWADDESSVQPAAAEIVVDRLDRRAFDDLASSEDGGSIVPPSRPAAPQAGRPL